MGTPLLLTLVGVRSPSSAIILLYLSVLWRGAQSVTADRDTYCSDDSDKYRGVKIIMYYRILIVVEEVLD